MFGSGSSDDGRALRDGRLSGRPIGGLPRLFQLRILHPRQHRGDLRLLQSRPIIVARVLPERHSNHVSSQRALPELTCVFTLDWLLSSSVAGLQYFVREASMNQVTAVSRSLFAGLISTLRGLQLDRNHITSIPDGTFTNFTALGSASFDDNRLPLGPPPLHRNQCVQRVHVNDKPVLGENPNHDAPECLSRTHQDAPDVSRPAALAKGCHRMRWRRRRSKGTEPSHAPRVLRLQGPDDQ